MLPFYIEHWKLNIPLGKLANCRWHPKVQHQFMAEVSPVKQRFLLNAFSHLPDCCLYSDAKKVFTDDRACLKHGNQACVPWKTWTYWISILVLIYMYSIVMKRLNIYTNQPERFDLSGCAWLFGVLQWRLFLQIILKVEQWLRSLQARNGGRNGGYKFESLNWTWIWSLKSNVCFNLQIIN